MRLANKLKKAMHKLLRLFEYETQSSRSSNVEIQNGEKLRFSHVLGQYLERCTKEIQKPLVRALIYKHNSYMYEDF